MVVASINQLGMKLQDAHGNSNFYVIIETSENKGVKHE
jgi:hypothetical protein